MKRVAALILLLSLNAGAQTSTPMNGPYIGCGKIIAKLGEPTIFEVDGQGTQHRLILTDLRWDRQIDNVAKILLIALSGSKMKHVCIRGIVFKDAQRRLVLLPQSANLRRDQLQ